LEVEIKLEMQPKQSIGMMGKGGLQTNIHHDFSFICIWLGEFVGLTSISPIKSNE